MRTKITPSSIVLTHALLYTVYGYRPADDAISRRAALHTSVGAAESCNFLLPHYSKANAS